MIFSPLQNAEAHADDRLGDALQHLDLNYEVSFACTDFRSQEEEVIDDFAEEEGRGDAEGSWDSLRSSAMRRSFSRVARA